MVFAGKGEKRKEIDGLNCWCHCATKPSENDFLRGHLPLTGDHLCDVGLQPEFYEVE